MSVLWRVTCLRSKNIVLTVSLLYCYSPKLMKNAGFFILKLGLGRSGLRFGNRAQIVASGKIAKEEFNKLKNILRTNCSSDSITRE